MFINSDWVHNHNYISRRVDKLAHASISQWVPQKETVYPRWSCGCAVMLDKSWDGETQCWNQTHKNGWCVCVCFCIVEHPWWLELSAFLKLKNWHFTVSSHNLTTGGYRELVHSRQQVNFVWASTATKIAIWNPKKSTHMKSTNENV